MKLPKIIKKLTASKELKNIIKYVEKNDTELDLTKYGEFLEEIKEFIRPTVKKVKITNLKTLKYLPKELVLETIEITEPIKFDDLEMLNKMNLKNVICTNIIMTKEQSFQENLTSIIDRNGRIIKYKDITAIIKNYKVVLCNEILLDELIVRKKELDIKLLFEYLNDYKTVTYETLKTTYELTKTTNNTLKISISSNDITEITNFLDLIKEWYSIDELEIEVLNKEYTEKPYVKLKEYYDLTTSYADTLSLKYVEYNRVSSIKRNKQELTTHLVVNSLDEIIEFYNLMPNLTDYVIDLNSANKYIENFDYTKFKNINKNTNLTFRYGYCLSYKMNLKELIDLRSSIMWFRSLIDDTDLSPCEKLLYAYDIVKTFKYKLSENDKTDYTVSRAPHMILNPNNNNIVCSGYATLLDEITNFIDKGLKTTYSGVDIKEDTKTSVHMRNVVKIDDEKYDIHGLFVMDPTWDSEKTDKEELAFLGSAYTSLDLYIYFLIPLCNHNHVFGEEDTTVVLKEFENFILNKEVYLNDFAKYSQKLFGKIVDKEELEKYLNPKTIYIETFCEMLKNVRIKQGFSLDKIEEEIERVKLINMRKYKRNFTQEETIENNKSK